MENKWRQVPLEKLPRSGSTVIKSSPAIVGNSSGGADNIQSEVIKDRPGSTKK
jgi:hypothetical protein